MNKPMVTISEEMRKRGLIKFFEEFDGVHLPNIDASLMADAFMKENPDPYIKQLEKEVATARSEYGAFTRVMQKKNTDITILQNKLGAALNTIKYLRSK